ncbi:MAG TPA: CHRD domain-containing protein [Candidatus Acidoferrales bacterium]|nr:CHRD domain-containing protein [Candidatus Acidoferrales bacterium]
MKKVFLALLASIAVTSQAELIPIGVSPARTDAAVGLSPSNEVPAVAGNSGSGGAISGGVVFDTDTRELVLMLGYGSAAGFSDLTGPATSMTLNGPAGTNQTAAVLEDLGPFSFPSTNPAAGGLIFGTVTVPTNGVSDLLAGFYYVNIGTAANTNGEIRGQLIPLPPTISCPEPITVECGTQVVLTAEADSQAGNAMTIVWSMEGMALYTNQVAAGTPPTSTNVTFASELPLGTNIIDVTVTDSAGLTDSCETTVTVIDTIPPVITNAWACPNVLWPPNHKLVTVTIHAGVTDNCGPTTWKIIGVQSNEPVNGKGDGNTSPDWCILGPHTVALRAERSGTGTGRIYTITIQAEDESGNLSAPFNVTVTVPHDMSHKNGHDDDPGNDNDNGNGKGK